MLQTKLLNLSYSSLNLQQAIEVGFFVHHLFKTSLELLIIITMLLNNYAHFNAISKDSFAEELLFKIE